VGLAIHSSKLPNWCTIFWFINCCYFTHLRRKIKEWTGLLEVHSTRWQGLTIKKWWSILTDGTVPSRKAMSLLVMSKLWSERNARVFINKFAPPFVVLDKIRKGAACGCSQMVSIWVICCLLYAVGFFVLYCTLLLLN
jgi:hypothetical protein